MNVENQRIVEIFGNAENFRPIEGYESYYVSNLGRVRNVRTGKTLRASVGSGNYLTVKLVNEDHSKTFHVHRLVAKAFLPEPEPGQNCVDHINGSRGDNNVLNLRWSTYRQNNANRKKKGGTSSRYKGVHWHKKAKKWSAGIRGNDGRRRHLGLFQNEIDGAIAYNEVAIEVFGEFAKLNEIPEAQIP